MSNIPGSKKKTENPHMCSLLSDRSNFFKNRFRNLRIQLSFCNTDFFNQILGLNNFGPPQSKWHNSRNLKKDANPDVEVISETNVVGYSVESWKMFEHRVCRRNERCYTLNGADLGYNISLLDWYSWQWNNADRQENLQG